AVSDFLAYHLQRQKKLGDLAETIYFKQQPYDVVLANIDIIFGPLVEALKAAFLQFRPEPSSKRKRETPLESKNKKRMRFQEEFQNKENHPVTASTTGDRKRYNASQAHTHPRPEFMKNDDNSHRASSSNTTNLNTLFARPTRSDRYSLRSASRSIYAGSTRQEFSARNEDKTALDPSLTHASSLGSFWKPDQAQHAPRGSVPDHLDMYRGDLSPSDPSPRSAHVPRNSFLFSQDSFQDRTQGSSWSIVPHTNPPPSETSVNLELPVVCFPKLPLDENGLKGELLESAPEMTVASLFQPLELDDRDLSQTSKQSLNGRPRPFSMTRPACAGPLVWAWDDNYDAVTQPAKDAPSNLDHSFSFDYNVWP
ncbi:hypothetical protein H0H81_004084, partial [Sphagnurus paluster]